MKKYIIVVLVVVIAVALFATSKKTIEVTNPLKVEVKEVEVKVDALQAKVDAAIASSSNEIETRAKHAYSIAKRNAEVEIELAVRAEYKKELDKREKELQKESVAY